MNKLTPKTFAKLINLNCRNFEYFWASGLIRETIRLWQTDNNYKMLCRTAKIMVDKYVTVMYIDRMKEQQN